MKGARLASWGLPILLLAGYLTACLAPTPALPPSPELPRVVRVVGATDMAPFVDDLRARAQALNPPVEVRYTPTNTATGLRLLREGRADLALASWLPDGPPPGFQALAIAEDDVSIVVHPRTGISALSLEEVRRVFEGRYLSWAEVGGQDVPIRMVSREEGSGTRDAFEHLVMGEARVALTAVVLPSGRDVVGYVARHEGAVGYVSARLVGNAARIVQVDGTRPGRDDYPLRRTLYLVLPETADAWLLRLVAAYR